MGPPPPQGGGLKSGENNVCQLLGRIFGALFAAPLLPSASPDTLRGSGGAEGGRGARGEKGYSENST